MSAVTWLHISDLHFRESKPYDFTVVRDSLLRDIAERVKIAPELGKIDFIFLTGDIAFSGKSEEYSIAQHFLDRLRQITGVSKKRLFVVPGNHDVDRGQISDESRDLLSKLGSRQAVNELLGNATDRIVVMERLRDYGRFINGYYGKQRVFNEARYYYVVKRKIADKQIAVLGLNSAWASSSDADQLNLFLGERQVREAMNTCASADIRFVLIHHPFSWLRDFDADNCEPLLLDSGSIIMHGHLHKPKIIQLLTPSANSMLVGAGAVYETREFPNSYSFGQLDLETRQGCLYLRAYSDKDGGFWTADNRTYRNIDGVYRFQLAAKEKAGEAVTGDPLITHESELDDTGIQNEKARTKTREKRRTELPGLHKDALREWWKERRYTSDPFLFPRAEDLSDSEALLDTLQTWYVDPNLPASPNASGGTPTIDEIMSTETADLVLIYAPSGGGKTFCRRWATKQIEVSSRGSFVEISNLAGRLPDPEKIIPLDLMLCIYKTICEKYGLPETASPLHHIQHVLTECNLRLKNLSSFPGTDKKVIVFVDDIDQLFDEDDAKKNLNVLKALADLCGVIAGQSGMSLVLRLFLPLELKESLQQLLGVKTRQRIQEVTLRWRADHCESVLEARLASCWVDGPNTYRGRHLERLLHPDALTELRRQLPEKDLSPRCVIRLVRELCSFAYQKGIAADSTISSDLMVEFLNSKISGICPPVQYPLTTARSSDSRRVGQVLRAKLLKLSAGINKIVNGISKAADFISAFWLLSLLIAAVLFIFWVMVQKIWYGRDINILSYIERLWSFIVEQIQQVF